MIENDSIENDIKMIQNEPFKINDKIFVRNCYNNNDILILSGNILKIENNNQSIIRVKKCMIGEDLKKSKNSIILHRILTNCDDTDKVILPHSTKALKRMKGLKYLIDNKHLIKQGMSFLYVLR